MAAAASASVISEANEPVVVFSEAVACPNAAIWSAVGPAVRVIEPAIAKLLPSHTNLSFKLNLPSSSK